MRVTRRGCINSGTAARRTTGARYLDLKMMPLPCLKRAGNTLAHHYGGVSILLVCTIYSLLYVHYQDGKCETLHNPVISRITADGIILKKKTRPSYRRMARKRSERLGPDGLVGEEVKKHDGRHKP